ncbi:tripartite tricarboxylate transporter substrate binding protein [Curvibacter sp. RS43]|uniref:Bug family tripartite tricarboxylate transporter substrate binding protein n=1 Tax=Curvibacter microcysteis TaxID=3026419 RepID=UPI00235EAC99|nr:tripartite tricarboxylate transporter substrate binding protein [Curvibacter sp. RS43]MDD0811537.1 tripartite tricarboxylate transporter substrate binding protein [Curvibacter sp. RS43]
MNPTPRHTVQRRQLLLALCLSSTGLASSPTWAAYPERPIRIVVPFAPGGGTDLVARSMSVAMGQELGQSVIIENKPGGATLIGTDAVAKSAPDGYTLVMATLAHVVNPTIQPKLPYAHDKAFAPVMLVGVSPNVLVVNPKSPYKTVQDIINAAKASPGKLSFASQGAGTSAHLAGELFKNLSGTFILHIPYRGAGPALTDLMGGQVDMMFATASAVGNLIESGKLRAIAVTTEARSKARNLANLPTIAESGVPGYVADSWYGLFAPAATPKDIVTRLNAAANKAVQTEAFKKQLENEGLVIKGGTPQDFDAYAKREEGRWRKVVKDNNITAD